jgi:hypothetical protein
MKDAIEMGSGDKMYIPSFIKIGSGVQKLMWGIRRQHGGRISVLQESSLNISYPCLQSNPDSSMVQPLA